MAEPTLSAVVACYKDAQAIPVMHRRLTAAFTSIGVSYEIIFVNDGSPDDSDAVLEQLTSEDEHVLAIEHSRNFGSQNAFTSGMHVAAGRAVVLLDGDLQDPPELIGSFYELWLEGNDVVYGRRRRRTGQPIFGFFAAVFYRVFRAVSDVSIPLDAGDFALMDRKVVDALLELPETDQFLRGLRAWVGFSQTGVDYDRPPRAFGRSTHSWLKNLWWAKKGLFSFSFIPIEALGYLALVLTLCSAGAVLYQAVDTVQRPEVSHGLAWLGVLVAFFGSVNLLALSVLGEYLSKILEEVKRRPKFIRKALRHGRTRLTNADDIQRFLRERARTTHSGETSTRSGSEGHEG